MKTRKGGNQFLARAVEASDNQDGLRNLAGTTGLEPATSDVTGRRSNQLNYVPFEV
jgi:hypothetical protein